MKKRIAMLFICGMALLCAACGSTSEMESPTPTVVATPTEAATSTPTPEPTATSTPTPEPTATSTPTPTPEPTSTPAPVSGLEDTYVKGTVTETGFESEWMNLRFTTPEGAVMVSREELDARMQQAVERLYGDYAEAAMNYTALTTVIEMMAKNADDSNVVIQVEKLPLFYSSMTEEDYLKTLVQDLEISYGNAGIEFTTNESVYEIEISGEKYTGITTGVDYGTGELLYQVYVVRKKEDRMIAIIFTYTDSSVENVKRLAESFGSYDSEQIVLPEPTVDPTEAPVASTEEFSTGVINGNVYENAWAGIRFTASEGVVFSADDRTAMTAIWPGEHPVVVLTLQNVYGLMTVEEYVELLKDNVKNLADTGMEYVIGEDVYTVELGGQEYQAFVTSTDMVYQEYYVREKDGYMITIAFIYTEEDSDKLKEIVDAFSAY